MPSFNVEKFKSTTLKSGFLRENKFEMRFTLPPALLNNPNNVGGGNLRQTAEELSLWCEATTLPGVQLSTTEVRRYGYGVFEKKPYNATFTELSVVLFGDADGKNWKLFRDWINYIFNADVNNQRGGQAANNLFQVNYKKGPTGYATNVDIIVYDDVGKPKITVQLNEAYPVFMGPINLNWGSTNQIMRIPITLTFYTWSVLSANT